MKRAPEAVTAYAPAKVNIGWRVKGRREDGFHEVCGCIQTLSLCDRLDVSSTDIHEAGVTFDVGRATLRLAVPEQRALETEDNLIVRAARVLAERVKPRPVGIALTKSIPVAAGLGGGSADAAASLVALNALWGGRLTAREIVGLGARVGSDVPALVVGGLVHVSGRGERVQPIGSFDDGWVVLGVGDERVSARDAYDMYDALADRAPREALYANDLEQAACAIVQGLRDRVDRMREETGVAFVSGSGPTVVGVVSDEPRAHEAARAVRDAFSEVLVARPVGTGVRLRFAT